MVFSLKDYVMPPCLCPPKRAKLFVGDPGKEKMT